jgi:hypothetical protein
MTPAQCRAARTLVDMSRAEPAGAAVVLNGNPAETVDGDDLA